MTETLEKTETKTFAAETARVLNLMIHALYTNRDIFLRELISNASDACDKLRYEALTNENLLGDAPDLTIHIGYDEKAKTLTITDTGIGMNREDLIANLGTIAKSGTTEFLEKMEQEGAKDVNLIGQFGVGFYASFMVADKVTVESRKAGEEASWAWESDGKGSYDIKPGSARARGFALEHTAENFDLITLAALGGKFVLPGLALIQKRLDVGLAQLNQRWNAVHHATNRFAMGFTPSSETEDITERIASH